MPLSQQLESPAVSRQLDVRETVQQLAALSRQDVPVAVRNNLRGIASFTDEHTGHSMTWEAAGDPGGRDIREVPPAMLLNPQFRENVLRGIYTVEADDAVLQDSLDRQRGAWNDRQLEAAGAAAAIDDIKDQTIATGAACIAPRNARELCGNYGVVMGKDGTDAPPLCGEHEHLAPLYAPVKSGRQIGGKDEILWKRK